MTNNDEVGILASTLIPAAFPLKSLAGTVGTVIKQKALLGIHEASERLKGCTLGFKAVHYRQIQRSHVEEAGADDVRVGWLINKENDGAQHFVIRLFDIAPYGHILKTLTRLETRGLRARRRRDRVLRRLRETDKVGVRGFRAT